jgi:inosose dehydratase
MERLLDIFDSVPDTRPRPKPTLADAGSPERWRRPGAAARDQSLGWDDAGWRRFGEGIARVAERCRRRGYEPTLHHHTGTYLEAVWEIERALEISDVGLCLDTGHLLVGGSSLNRIACPTSHGRWNLRRLTRWPTAPTSSGSISDTATSPGQVVIA